MIEEIRDAEAHPEDEAKERDTVDADDAAEALLPELPNVGDEADGEEAEAEEDAAEKIRLPRARSHGLHRRRIRKPPKEHAEEHDKEADEELREALIDFLRGDLVALALLNVLAAKLVDRPDDGEHESPDADEDIDEDLRRRRGHERPALLIVDAILRERLRADERVGDGTGGNRAAVALHREAHPSARDERIIRKERRRNPRENQKLHRNEHNDNGGNDRRHDGAGANRAARRNRCRDAADGDARRHRCRPLRRELKELARDDVDDRPVNEIRLDDRAHAAEDNRARESHRADRLDGDGEAEDDDARLDVPLRLCRRREERRRLREEIADDKAEHQRDDEAELAETEAPAHAELRRVLRRRREIRIVAEHHRRRDHRIEDGKARRKALQLEAHKVRARARDDEEENVCREERPEPAEEAKLLAVRRDRLRDVRPDAVLRRPAEEIDPRDLARAEDDDEQSEPDRPPVLTLEESLLLCQQLMWFRCHKAISFRENE